MLRRIRRLKHDLGQLGRVGGVSTRQWDWPALTTIGAQWHGYPEIVPDAEFLSSTTTLRSGACWSERLTLRAMSSAPSTTKDYGLAAAERSVPDLIVLDVTNSRHERAARVQAFAGRGPLVSNKIGNARPLARKRLHTASPFMPAIATSSTMRSGTERSADDGGSALAAAERSVPDLLVLDVAMPGMDGLAVCSRFRAKGLALPILLLTARDALPIVWGVGCGRGRLSRQAVLRRRVLARVRALLRRGHEPARFLAVDDVVLDLRSRAGRRRGRDLGLSARARPICSSCCSETLVRSSPARWPSTGSGAGLRLPARTLSTATSPICDGSSGIHP